MLNMDLRNFKPKPSHNNDQYNPLIDLTDNPLKGELLFEPKNRNLKNELNNNVKKNLFTSDFNRKYISNNGGDNVPKRRVELEVDKLAQKSLKRFEYIN